MVSGIVLAAGKAVRMGRPKLLLELGGQPVLRRVLEAALRSSLDEVSCVVREPEAMAGRVALAHDRLHWIANPAADRGQSTSIVAGLRALHNRSEAALFVAGDQPMITAELIDALLDHFKSSKAWIIAPAYRGEARNPVLFRRELFSELLGLTGDRGGRGLMQKFPAQTALIEWRDERPFLDLDTSEDYEKLKRFF